MTADPNGPTNRPHPDADANGLVNGLVPPTVEESADARLMHHAMAHLMANISSTLSQEGEDSHAAVAVGILAFMLQTRRDPEWADEVFRITWAEFILSGEGGASILETIAKTLTPETHARAKELRAQQDSQAAQLVRDFIARQYNAEHSN